jgi:HKD family nuclease
MEGLWTNRRLLGDFVQNGLRPYQTKVSEIFIAVAFFTEKEVVKEFLDNNCHIRMVVRLGFPTNPDALRSLYKNPNIEIRYYSDPYFHPKLYLITYKTQLL